MLWFSFVVLGIFGLFASKAFFSSFKIVILAFATFPTTVWETEGGLILHRKLAPNPPSVSQTVVGNVANAKITILKEEKNALDAKSPKIPRTTKENHNICSYQLTKKRQSRLPKLKRTPKLKLRNWTRILNLQLQSSSTKKKIIQ
jgi:hypothetical protein